MLTKKDDFSDLETGYSLNNMFKVNKKKGGKWWAIKLGKLSYF